jgi:hypothetical protein
MTEADDRPRYLDDRWLTEADAALAGLTPVGIELTIGVTVTGGPDGDRRYRMVLGPDRVGIDPGAGSAGVRMTLAWPDAVAVAQGNISAQRAFLDGRLRLGGDTGLLLGHQDALADLDDRLAPLRAVTRFD